MIHAVDQIHPTGLIIAYCGQKAKAQTVLRRGSPVVIGAGNQVCAVCVQKRRAEASVVAQHHDPNQMPSETVEHDDQGRPLGRCQDDSGLGELSDNSGIGQVHTPW